MSNAGEILLSIVIVNWNGREIIKNCLTSIHDTVKMPHEIIMVDNNSSDGSADFVEREFPGTIVLRQTRNLGFSKGSNIGSGRSVGAYILFLNPDVIVLRDTVDMMVDYLAAHKEIGILGPKILDAYGNISEYGKRRLPTLPQEFAHHFLLQKAGRAVKSVLSKNRLIKKMLFQYYEKSEECEYLSGSCMLMARDTIKSLHGFDETVPMYLDDMDICYRSRKSGKKNYYAAESAIVHIGQISTKKSERYKLYDVLCYQAHSYYYRKNFGPAKFIFYRLIVLLSIPYLLLLDILAAPYFLLSDRKKEYFWIVRKHIRYLDVVLDRPIEAMEEGDLL